jgi:GMP synthase-like glutamine amidotransferase
MTLLGVGKFCRNQIVRVGTNAYGIQCHFELTKDMLGAWCEEDPDLRRIKRDVLISQFNVIKDEYIKNARMLFKNFLKISGV